MKYRIAWKSKSVGTAGGGDFVFDSYEDARQVAEDANREYPEFFHWVEPSE